jgi:tight adherence protein C
MNHFTLLAGLFTFIMAAVTAAGYIVTGRNRIAEEAQPGPSAILMQPDAADTAGFGVIVRAFQIVGERVPRSHAAANPLRSRLIAAGYRMPHAVATFYGIKCAAATAAGVLAAWASVVMDSQAVLPFICGAAFGYMLPDRVLGFAVKARMGRLRQALPNALDMLVLAVEAGQSIDQALVATGRGLKQTYPDLSAELTMLHLETRASNDRAEALRNFAERNTEPELRKLAALMIDTDRFGTALGPALRDHARYLRIRSRQKLQEAARKVGVKLIFPVFFLIFPSVILVTLGPAVILIFTQLKSMV